MKVHEIKVPSSYAPFVCGDWIRLGEWPDKVYAGRSTIYGERLPLSLLKRTCVR